MAKSFYDFNMKNIKGAEKKLADYKDKVVLVVNVASQCGLTPQYEGLEKMYEQYKAQGLEVLGFPANEFGAQEPGSNAEIEDFCISKFGVKFPMFEKIVVKGEGQHPLYNYLTTTKPEVQPITGNAFEDKLKNYGVTRTNKNDILWNFEKFLINKKGEVVARFNPDVAPDNAALVQAVESELKK